MTIQDYREFMAENVLAFTRGKKKQTTKTKHESESTYHVEGFQSFTYRLF